MSLVQIDMLTVVRLATLLQPQTSSLPNLNTKILMMLLFEMVICYISLIYAILPFLRILAPLLYEIFYLFLELQGTLSNLLRIIYILNSTLISVWLRTTKNRGWSSWGPFLKIGFYQLLSRQSINKAHTPSDLVNTVMSPTVYFSASGGTNVLLSKSLLHKTLGHPSVKVLSKVALRCNMKFRVNHHIIFEWNLSIW